MASRKSISGGGVCVAEYLGQRTDIDTPEIQPAASEAMCPFMNSSCSKLRKGLAPVCSVRKSDGTFWISCEHRLCATLKQPPLSDYQKQRLLEFAKVLFDDSITLERVSVRREAGLKVHEDTDYKADYIITIDNGRSCYPGPDRLIAEMQGGGETTNTKKISTHVKNWENNPNRTNIELRRQVPGTGTLETNAWRRQQEQFIVKGNVAMKTWKGYGISFFVGAPLYDYVMKKIPQSHLPNLRDHNWTLAFIGVSEDTSKQAVRGPVPLVVDQNKILFTNYQTFVQALINQGEPTSEAFAGEFDCLDGSIKHISIDGRPERSLF